MSAFSPPNYLETQRWHGLRIGLLGGSFHPPHTGHIKLSRAAIKLLDLDFVWWLVTPKNPIKETVSPASYEQRLKEAQDMTAQHPLILVSRLEQVLESAYTYQTLLRLRRYFPATSFIWLGGIDLALGFHRWKYASALPDLAPFAFFARPPAYQLVTGNMMMMRSDLAHKDLHGCIRKPKLRPRTIYWAREWPMHNISSTELRNQ